MWNLFNWYKRKKEPVVVDTSVVLPGNKVLNKLLEAWPWLNPGRLWPADTDYVMPLENELEWVVFNSPVIRYEYVPEIQDCDDAALLLHADIVRRRYDEYKKGKIPENEKHPWAFGEIWYQDPVRGPHAINLCITRDKGILLIEPQGGKIRKPQKDMTISFIRL